MQSHYKIRESVGTTNLRRFPSVSWKTRYTCNLLYSAFFYCNYHLCYQYLKVLNPINADYICDEEDDAIIKSISCCNDGDRLIVRIDDAFVTFDNFKCLLSPSEYLNGDVNTIYIKKFLYTNLYFCMVILNKIYHLIAGYKRVHIPH